MAKKAITKLSELTPDANNYNKGTEFGGGLIEKSLRKLGAGRSILLDKNGKVIAGNKTLENAVNAGFGDEDLIVVQTTGKQIVAVQRMDLDLDSKMGKEMALADNATAKANIEWDTEAIASDWNSEDLADWGIDGDGWANPSNALNSEAVEDDFEVPDIDEVQTDIVLGDLFEIGPHRLLCGDSTKVEDVERLMGGAKADMVFTDPPYGVDYSGGIQFSANGDVKKNQREKLENDDSEQIYAASIPIMASITKGPCYTWFADSKAGTIYNTIKKFGEIHALIIWVKNGGYGALNANYKQKHEPCLYWKPKNGKLNFCGATTESTIWEINKDGRNEFHPTQKPVALAAKAISNHEANSVADIFLGSGTTMVAAHQLNRKCYGMELSEKYCQVIVDRMLKLDPTLEVKKNGVAYVPKS
jgi:DNA modification methylase